MTLEDLSRVFIANGFSSAPVERTATGTQPKWPDAFAGSVTQADLVLFALENLQSGPLFDMQQQIGVSQRVRTTRVAAITSVLLSKPEPCKLHAHLLTSPLPFLERFSEKKPFPAVRASRETLLDTVLLLGKHREDANLGFSQSYQPHLFSPSISPPWCRSRGCAGR